MLDIEFISEIVIGYLHGVQNKKDTLDNWYEAYEEEFENRRDVESTFNTILGEIHSCLPDMSETRWRKKSDFYSLFLVLTERKNILPLSRDLRSGLGEGLKVFARDVDRFLRNPGENGDVSDSVKRYAAGVERAASDLANRRTRRDELRMLLDEHLENPA
jgi:hypothetical protein